MTESCNPDKFTASTALRPGKSVAGRHKFRVRRNCCNAASIDETNAVNPLSTLLKTVQAIENKARYAAFAWQPFKIRHGIAAFALAKPTAKE
ncbi:MAG: hypothetical protein R3D32_10740 [Nitratireductor sp.]